MNIDDLLRIAMERRASDLHLKVGNYPHLRIDGELIPLTDQPRVSAEDMLTMAFSMMSARQKQKFKETTEIDMAYGVAGLGRFRVNVFQQRGNVGLVLRVIPTKIRALDELYLPKVVEQVCDMPRGLVLVTGVTGSGKSTTLAAMVDRINSTRAEHIITIEDPIEFLHRDKKGYVNQREVEVDTPSFGAALRASLRQDPDVILVGEMRDLETIATALHAAETGHMVFSTLHTLDAVETINRIIAIFPPPEQKQIRLQLAAVMRAVISQRLVKRCDGEGRVPAVEVMINTAERIAKAGGTPIAVSQDGRPLGVVYLKDIVKGGVKERFAELRSMGIRTVMITGDNPLTAAAIAAEAGVDDFLAQATPEKKLELIREEQTKGRMIAMCGDGTNDAPALAQADVGVAMQTGTVAAREAGNMVDLDSDPTKLIEIVGIGKQLLMTRGALTTFSIANDVAKYFAIIPVMFAAIYPQLVFLNVMGLNPRSAILSAIIFNALIIVMLIPLALRGVPYRPAPAAHILSRNLLIYGGGGIIAPFVGIKIVDLIVNAAGFPCREKPIPAPAWLRGDVRAQKSSPAGPRAVQVAALRR